MTRESLLLAGDVIALVANLSIIVVWLVYGIFFRWNKTHAGRAVFVFLSALVLLLVMNVITVFLGKEWFDPSWYVREWFRLLVYLFALTSVIWMAGTLLTNWRRTGVVLDLEARARHARATLEGKPITKETPKQ